jgi:uncharacterized protein (TIGR03437 family)
LAVLAVVPIVLRAQIANIAVTNGASFQAGLPQSGSIGTIFCTGLSVAGVVSAPGTPLPTSLAGVSVTVGGVPAPLFAVAGFAGYQQINFQVPQGFQYQLPAAPGPSTANVVVSQGAAKGTAAIPLLSGLGAFFRMGNTQYGIFQHGADYSLVTTDNPARADETIVACATGLETPKPAVPDGQATPMSPPYYVPQSYLGTFNIDETGIYVTDNTGFQVSISPGASSQPGSSLLFMGLAPGLVGVYQINFIMPKTHSGVAAVAISHATCNPGLYDGCNQRVTVVSTAGQPVLIPVQ